MKDYESGQVTIGEIDKVTFHFASGKECIVHIGGGTWSQSGSMIDPDIIRVMIQEMHEAGYFET